MEQWLYPYLGIREPDQYSCNILPKRPMRSTKLPFFSVHFDWGRLKPPRKMNSKIGKFNLIDSRDLNRDILVYTHYNSIVLSILLRVKYRVKNHYIPVITAILTPLLLIVVFEQTRKCV